MAVIVRKPGNKLKPYTVRYWHEDKQRERSFRTKREAQEFVARFEHERREGSYVDPREGSMSFGEYANRWLTMLVVAPNTKRTYRSALDRWILPALGPIQLRRITRERLRDLLLVDLPNRGAQPGTVARIRLVLGAVLAEAEREKKITQNPARGIKIPSTAKSTDFFVPTPKQLDALTDAMPSGMALMVPLMAGCGLRMGEALAVKADAPTHGTLRIREQKLVSGLYGPLKHRKPGDYRDVPFPAFVAQRWPTGRAGYLFAVVGRKGFSTAFRKACEVAGIPDDFTPHDLRHVFASVSLSHGVPITDVAAWLGHSDIRVTVGIYGHLVPSALARAREVLDEWHDSA
jgi:integrase